MINRVSSSRAIDSFPLSRDPRFDQLFLVDPTNIAASEYARHVAWMGRESLSKRLDGFDFSDDRDMFAAQLDEVASLLTGAAAQLRDAGNSRMDHFGDS